MEFLVALIIAGAAGAAIILPLLRSDTGRKGTLEDEPVEHAPPLDVEDVEREITRYRAALRAGTLCSRCAQANPDGSRYCFECGQRLPPQRASEPATAS